MLNNEKALRKLNSLKEDREDLLIELEQQKKEFIEFISNSDAKKISEMGTYTDYTKLMNITKQLNEIEIKIRTLEFAIS
jgi:hypothetical protein